MNVILDIETVPCADKEPFLAEAADNFKAPSSLTKDQAGADLGMTKDEIKFTGKPELIARWEKEMAAEKAGGVAEEMWRKTALDGTRGRVLSIGWRVESENFVAINDPDSEADTIKRFFSELSGGPTTRPPFFIGHNIAFDLKFLFRRAAILGIRPPFELPFRGRHDQHYFCTMQAWCEFGERISLDRLATALGIEGKGDIDGSHVCDLWLDGDYEAISTYNQDDVRLTAAVYERLTFKALAA